MKTLITSKLMRRCLILVVMILGLVYVASSDKYAKPVIAAPCCEQCPGGGDPGMAEDACGSGCAVQNQVFGVDWQHCFDECVHQAQQCYSHCVYCNSPGGGGGDCSSTGDCPVYYFCGADNTCQHY